MTKSLRELIKEVKIEVMMPGEPVCVKNYPDSWRCIGIGTKAAVFQPKNKKDISIKIYPEPYIHIAKEEAKVYQELGETPLFPCFYYRGDNYIIISFRPGKSVFDCLLKGIFIPEQVIIDVEEAIDYARSKGLNPSDIHTKNIIVHKGGGYLIDVSEYGKNKVCKRWEHLKRIYYEYYLDMYKPGFTIPFWVLEAIRKWHKYNNNIEDVNISNYADRIKKIFFKTNY